MAPAFQGTIETFPEFGRSRVELLKRARELGWYHTLKLDDDFTTPGFFALDDQLQSFLIPESLAGLNCLEIGSGNGYWSFQMERRGAASVTATDIGDLADTDFSRTHDQPPARPPRSPEGAFGEPLRIAATLFNSRIRYRITSVYDLNPAELGQFDVVFCSSMLMHLFAPQLALQRLTDVCRGALILSTQTDVHLDGDPFLRYYGDRIPYVHFVPSPTCLVDMVRACGYEQVLRGPTFGLVYRDPATYPEPVVHTSLIALKDGAKPPFALPPAQIVAEADRTARLEVVTAPPRVHLGQQFDVIVRVTNASASTWRSPAGVPVQLHGELHTTAGPVSSGVETVAEYLPGGVSTLARLRMKAPLAGGTSVLRLGLAHGGQTFRTNTVEHWVTVDPAAPAAVPGPPPALPVAKSHPVVSAVRKAPGGNRRSRPPAHSCAADADRAHARRDATLRTPAGLAVGSRD